MSETRNMKYVISLPLGQFIMEYTRDAIVGTKDINYAMWFSLEDCIKIQKSLVGTCKCIFFEFESYIPTWRK